MTDQSLDITVSNPTVVVTPAQNNAVTINANDATVVVAESANQLTLSPSGIQTVEVYDPTQGLKFTTNPNNPFLSTATCNATVGNVVSIAGFCAITLRWTTTGDSAHVNIYRATSTNFAHAEIVGDSDEEAHTDTVEPGVAYTYWFEAVDYNGTTGPLSLPHSVTSGNNATGFVEALGNLTAAHLSPELTNLLNQIIGDSADEQAALRDGAISEQVIYIDTQYGQLLQFVNQYRAEMNTADSSSLAQLETQTTFFATQTSALAQQLSTLSASVVTDIAAANAAITQEQTTRASEIEAVALTVTTLDSTLSTDLSAADARISSEAGTRANAVEAVANEVTQLETDFQTDLTSTRSLVTQEANTRSAENLALAETVTQLTADLSTTETSVNASLTNQNSALAMLDSAVASTQQSLVANYDTLHAGITSEAAVRASESAASAGRLDTLEAGDSTTGSVAWATNNTLVTANSYADDIASDAAQSLSESVDAFGSQLNNLRIQARQGNNLLDMSVWVPQSIDDHLTGVNGGEWILNGLPSENTLLLHSEGPSGHSDVVWQAKSINGFADGGWNTGSFDVDSSKTYRAVVWIKKMDTNNGTTYFGCMGNTQNSLSGAPNFNPYFFSGDVPELNKWYLLVGILHGASYDGGYSGVSGVYDPTTGEKIVDCREFIMASNTTTQSHRSYLYSTTSPDVVQYFAYPRFEAVDGNEPTLGALMSTSDFVNTVSVTKRSVDGILGEYAVRIDDNGRVAGFGLINGAGTSDFDIVADKFSIANPDTPTVKDLYYDGAANTMKFRGQLILSNGADSTYTVSDLSDIQAQDGDTIHVEFQYSANGTTWHSEVATGDTYIRTRTVTNEVAGDWGNATNLQGVAGYTPVKGADYYDGTGRYISYIFKTGTTQPTTPTTGSYTGTSEVVPTGWQDDPYAEPDNLTYVSKRTYTQQLEDGVAGSTWSASVWSAPSKFYEKGAAGDSYTGTTEYYRLTNSTSAPSIPATAPGLWSTSPQTPTSDNRYLWNYNKNSRTIGADINSPATLVTQYVEDGKGISSITEQYQRSSSNTAVPAAWGTYLQALPLSDAEPYLWNKTTTAYTDGSTTFTATIIAIKGFDADALTVTSTSTSDGVTTVTFSDNTSITVDDGAPGTTSGVKVIYASDPAGTGASFTQGSLKYVNYYEWTGSVPTVVPAGLTYTLFIGEDGDNAGVTPIYADDAAGTNASLTDSSKDYVNFYEWTGAAPLTPPTTPPLTYVKFVGDPGADSTVPGISGAGFYRYGSSSGNWPGNSTANNRLESAAGRPPVQDDVLTIYKSSDHTVSNTKRYNGSTWVTAALLIDGDMIATGTIRGDRVVAGSLSVSMAEVTGTLTAAHVSSITVTGDMFEANVSITSPNIYGANINGGTITGVLVLSGAVALLTDHGNPHYGYDSGVSSNVSGSGTSGITSAQLNIRPFNFHQTEPPVPHVKNPASNLWRYRRAYVTPEVSGSVDLTHIGGLINANGNANIRHCQIQIAIKQSPYGGITSVATFDIRSFHSGDDATKTVVLTAYTGYYNYSLSYQYRTENGSDGFTTFSYHRIETQTLTFTATPRAEGVSFNDNTSAGYYAEVQVLNVDGNFCSVGARTIRIQDTADNAY